MSAPDIDTELMEKFAPLAGDSHLTVILGAGASARFLILIFPVTYDRSHRGGVIGAKKVAAKRNERIGSYTVNVPKSAVTGRFTETSNPSGKMTVRTTTKRQSQS